ncbi:MAG: hypothetical protein WB819_07945 [Terriglobia bacterium]
MKKMVVTAAILGLLLPCPLAEATLAHAVGPAAEASIAANISRRVIIQHSPRKAWKSPETAVPSSGPFSFAAQSKQKTTTAFHNTQGHSYAIQQFSIE